MNLRILHHVIVQGKTHRFAVTVECPFQPEAGFMLVFRNEGEGDDCALLVGEMYGWDVTNKALMIRMTEWNIDDWQRRGVEAEQSFEDSRRQLINVVGCEYLGVVSDSSR